MAVSQGIWSCLDGGIKGKFNAFNTLIHDLKANPRGYFQEQQNEQTAARSLYSQVPVLTLTQDLYPVDLLITSG